MRNLILLLTVLSIISSCSIEKRLYRPGYHIEWRNNNKQNNKAIEHHDQSSNVSLQPDNIFKVEEVQVDNNLAEAKIESTHEINEIDKIKTLKKLTDNTCEEIILRSGIIIKGKVTEIGVDEIKYKKCENLEGPTIVILKKDVFMIKYANGTTDVFEEEKEEDHVPISQFPKSEVKSSNENQMTDSLGIISIILACLGMLITLVLSIGLGALIGLIALILGIVSSKRISDNPDKLKGKGMATAGIIIGSISLLLAITLLVLLLL